MKYFLFLMTTFISYSSNAQISANQVSVARYKEMAQNKTRQMNSFLSLEKDQSDSVAVINKDYYYQIASLQDIKLTLTERKEKLLKIESTWEGRLKKILNTGQYKRYFDRLKEEKAEWQRRQDSLQSIHHKK